MKSRFLVITIISIVIAILGSGMELYAYLSNNKSQCAFDENCDNNTSTGTSKTTVNYKENLGYLIAEGGSRFLFSIANIHHFLGEVEASEIKGIDLNEIKNILDEAITSMEKSQATYAQLKDLADEIPYNNTVIDKLIEFDYTEFQKKSGFLSSIFSDVKAYLSSGDVRGVYKQFYHNIGDLLSDMNNLKTDIESGIAPNLDKIWRLNQKCSEYKLFGQYVAEVFYQI
jgi:hypothetical protein